MILLYVREYLISKKLNTKKPKYQDYIFKEKDNIENLKRYCRIISKNYYIDEYDNLYFKYFYERGNKDKFILKMVPFIDNLYNFLLDFHKKNRHRIS